MQDLDRPLQLVNRSLWEEICSFSEEEVLEDFIIDIKSSIKMVALLTLLFSRVNSQLKSFGAKLKEQNNLFRKRSKAQSHEMKEVLYSNIVQANEVEDRLPK